VYNNNARQVNNLRVGQSTDIHRLVRGRPLILGGVTIDYPCGCLGHSDGDALLHAIGEALLGACGLKDLGTHFSDQDPSNKDRSSIDILEQVRIIIKNKGYEVGNIDSIIIIEQPKMAPHLDLMIQNIAKALEITINQVNVKATTSERLGYIGQREGVMAQAVVLVKEREL
jgi:2-C-methyl-D-erythritol 2,4-cyclodiphosphate synthase